MESDRLRQMSLEKERLDEEKERNPELFPEITWIDDNNTLETLGIHIPNKEGLPNGYLKIMPSDFIVEEIEQNGRITSISRVSEDFVDQEGETVYATLVKCGLSTLEAVEELSKLLEIPKERIGYAGIKDKDAITSQAISFRGIPIEKVESLSSPHLFLKDIRRGKGVVQKGGLQGNRFTILLRISEDSHDQQKIENALAALEKVRTEGFYNFFYLQRFGSPRLNNYKWGLSILKGDYEKAIRGLIGDPGLREIPYFINKRKEIVDLCPDWKKVLEKLEEFPLVFVSETKIVRHLLDNPTDFVGALLKVEEQVVLWVSAVASLLYNRKVSSYVLAHMEPPEFLPLFLSSDKNDWLPYTDDLEEVGIFPPDFRNIRAFRNISLQHKDIKTKDHARVDGAEVIPEGIVVRFTLGKGEYATTFLSHFVNLLGGKVQDDIIGNVIDTKQILGDETSETLQYFKDLNISKKENPTN